MPHFTDQIALTVIAPIREPELPALQQMLARIEDEISELTKPGAEALLLRFNRIKGVHFCRFVILPPFTDERGRRTPPQLVYSANIDDSLDAHLQAIRESGTAGGFAGPFSCCDGFDTSLPAADAVDRFIRRHRKPVHTFYRAYRGLTVDIIQSEQLLYETIQRFLQRKRVHHLSAAALRQEIEAYVAAALPDRKKCEAIRLPDYSLLKTGGLLLARLLLPLAILLIAAHFLHVFWYVLAASLVALVAAAAYLRKLEQRDPELRPGDRDYNRIRILAAQEDKIVQNQLTHLTVVKTGLFRRALQSLALYALNALAIYSFNKGKLGGIASIHFARWSLIDRRRRLLFFSNFDGSWETYLGDFVDRAAFGLTLAWSNNLEFPRTKWLVAKGAANEELFKSWARKYQEPTQVWYSAYRELSVGNIYRNHQIALGLEQPLSGDALTAWLKLL